MRPIIILIIVFILSALNQCEADTINCLVNTIIRDKDDVTHFPMYLPCTYYGMHNYSFKVHCGMAFKRIGLDTKINYAFREVDKSACNKDYLKMLNPAIINRVLFGGK